MASAFEYEYHSTPIHNLNPISKVFLFGFFMVIGGIYLDPRIRLPLLAVLLIILRIARVPLRNYKAITLLSLFATLLGGAYTAFLMVNPNYFKVYPADWVSTLIFQITPPDFPIIGRAAVTYGALLYWLAMPLTPIIVLLSMAGLLHTTSLSDIVSILSKLHLPFPIIFMTTVALRFVPELTQRIGIIQKAQSLRGWTSETRNPIKRITLLKPLLIPLTRYVVRSVDVMTISSSNRAFGLGPVTPVRGFDFAPLDILISIVSLLLMALGMYLLFAFNFGTI